MFSTTPLLIGLCSPAMGSGKTTVAQHLEYEHDFKRLSFASGLKAMLVALLVRTGLREFDALEIISDPELKESPLKCLGGKTPRYAMQTLGTEWGRNIFGEDFWVNIALAKAKSEMDKGNSVVFDDLRFTNEADAIAAMGGHIIRVVRPMTALSTPSHPSEGELNSYPVDAFIVNDTGLSGLRDSTDNILSFIRNYYT